MKKFILLFLILFFIFPIIAKSKYIVWDNQEKVYRDYGTITNYARALKKICIEYQKEISYYSNIVVIQSNIINMQKKYIKAIEYKQPKWYEVIWDKSKFFIGFILGAFSNKEINRYSITTIKP